MRGLLSTKLLAGGILLCVAFQMTAHQVHFLDSSSFSPSYTSISSFILNISLHEEKEDHKSSSLSSSFHGDEAAMILPPTCHFHNIRNRTINRIYFLHMRKAGGSSLRGYFAQVAKKHGLKFKAAEGYLHPEQPGHDKQTLYITHVREPIARAISHYKYEKRWDCKTQLRKLNHNDVFVPTDNNTVMSLYNFTTTNHSMSSKLWTCSSNCYARWASGLPAHVVGRDDDDDDLLNGSNILQQLEQAARESLWNYNVIIVSEWLQQNPDYVKSIESVFGVERLNRTRGMTCGLQAAAANQQVPLVVQPQDLQLLHQVNQVDLKLYQDLTACQPQFLLQQHGDVEPVIHWKGTANNKAKQQRRRRQKEGVNKKNKMAEKA